MTARALFGPAGHLLRGAGGGATGGPTEKAMATVAGAGPEPVVLARDHAVTLPDRKGAARAPGWGPMS